MDLPVGGDNGKLESLEIQKSVTNVMGKDLMKKHYVLKIII